MKVIFLVLLLTACSSSTYKAEMPNGDDKGIIFQGDSLVYSIPKTAPVDKMKLSFRGITEGNLLHIRMRFIRKGLYSAKNPESLDPKDLTIQLEGNGAPIAPTQVRANKKAKPLIQLTGDDKQAVELVYKIPLAKNQKAEFAFFNFHWRVQYAKGKFETQSVRFDRQYSKTNLSAIPYEDPDFGQYNEMDDMGWYPMGADWW